MRIGTIAVREKLPPTATHVTDKQIQESLWHYYYDVEKSVEYLANTYMKKPKEKAQKKEKKVAGGLISFRDSYAFCQCGGGLFVGSACGEDLWRWVYFLLLNAKSLWGSLLIRFKDVIERNTELRLEICSRPFSFADFFKDTPWFNIPTDRQAILIPPSYPRGGLLGGSSDGAPKVSKLQALAAARKKKAQEQRSSDSTGVEKPMASMNIKDNSQTGHLPASKESTHVQKPASRGFPLRKRKDSNPHEKTPKAPPTEREPDQDNPESLDIEPLDQATPSAFASTMFSNPSQPPTSQHPSSIFTLPYSATAAPTTTDPFAGPSPDDVVIAAQSKGSTNSASSKLKK